MRFAVLAHDFPFRHWDLLLEAPQGCWTWRLLDPPETAGVIRAERIADHRPLYLDYEGPVSGDRGVVMQLDAGEFIWLTATESVVAGIVRGRHWRGRLVISAESAGAWRLRYRPTENSAG